ncbi:hypothetical protein LTS08_002331 [Lithohypha guttulata]|nr:hypothetical protein LTS08_002331 [Lithohypha guttulata]
MLHSKGEATNANYVNAGLSLFILFARLIASRWRRRPLDLSFFLVVLSMLLMIARVVVINYYLHLGIASEAIREGPEYLNEHTLSDIEKGTKMWFAGHFDWFAMGQVDG